MYATDSTINIYHSSEGEDDARGFIHHVDYEHPGTELEHDEFVNNNINENLGQSCSVALVRMRRLPVRRALR